MANREYWAASTLGVLVGCMLGFSAQSEIAGAVAGLLTLATGLIGVAQPKFLAPSAGGDPNTRMICFGGTATAAFLLTYLLAINHVLEPSVASRLQELNEAGYEPPVAKAMIARHFYDVDVEGWQNLNGRQPPSSISKQDTPPSTKDGDPQP